jgi:hypothetical protein
MNLLARLEGRSLAFEKRRRYQMFSADFYGCLHVDFILVLFLLLYITLTSPRNTPMCMDTQVVP